MRTSENNGTTQIKRYVPQLVNTYLASCEEYSNPDHGVHFDCDSHGMFV